MAKKKPKPKIMRKSKLGLPPGSLVFTGTQKMETAEISVIQYSAGSFSEKKFQDPDALLSAISTFEGVNWINVDGLHDEELIEKLCTHLGVHRLSMEDILSVSQRTKLEEYAEYIHIVLRMFDVDTTDETIDGEQLSFLFKNNTLLTFQEKKGDVFDGIRTRIREDKGIIRKKGADYLLYRLLDTVVDQYFLTLENFSEKIEELEFALLENPNKEILNSVYELRRVSLSLRRCVYPLREMINRFEKLEEPIINKETKIYIRDLYDHSIQIIETVEVFREMVIGLLDLYMNSVSNKLNEIMKVLTIMSSIFIPLTFVVGVYGMNFDNIPILHYKYGYFAVWLIMALLVVVMVIFFKRKKWL